MPLVYGPKSKRELNALFRMANRKISVIVEKTFINVGYVVDAAKGSRFSMKKAMKDFDFSADYPLEFGLKLTADWYKEHGFRL